MAVVIQQRSDLVAGYPKLFGTDGIRKVVGAEITPTFLADVFSAYSAWINGPGPVVIAHDFRTTSDGIARILAGTLQMNGVNVYELGVMPTPCLQFNARAMGARAGLMVTASHNPTEFNGIKFCGPDGLEIPPEAEHEIEKNYTERRFRIMGWDGAGRIRQETRGVERYLTSILSHTDRTVTRKAKLCVVLDCGNGTSAVTSPTLLRELGVRLKTLNANPDGAFPGHPSEPTEENLADLRKAVVQFGADLGIAHDGDSDRIAFIDEKGRYVPGEVTLALLARQILKDHPGATIATSVTSSTTIEDVVREGGGKLVVSRSGSLPVAIAVRDHAAVFGGEENGHYYWPEHQNAPDGPMSSAKVIELVSYLRRPFSELVDELPKYFVVKTKVPLPPSLKGPVMEQAREILGKEADRLVTIDGVKAFYGSTWLLVRPSGTEPICRVFAEAIHPDEAARLARKGEEMVRGIIESLQQNQ
jgi:phosphomannomutase/phosphoglucomutase